MSAYRDELAAALARLDATERELHAARLRIAELERTPAGPRLGLARLTRLAVAAAAGYALLLGDVAFGALGRMLELHGPGPLVLVLLLELVAFLCTVHAWARRDGSSLRRVAFTLLLPIPAFGALVYGSLYDEPE